jgi:hypothetical protein
VKLLLSPDAKKLFDLPFEQELLKSAYSHLNNLNDPLRCNIFALLLRELIRTTISRMAPDSLVSSSPWYKSSEVTRRDRYRFVMTGKIPDEQIKNHPNLDTEFVCGNLLSTINKLSKYTHIGSGTINMELQNSIDFQNEVESTIIEFAQTLISTRENMSDILIQLLEEEIKEMLLNDLPDDLAALSSQTLFDSLQISQIDPVDLSVDEPVISGKGTVFVELNYGKGEDGFSSDDHYPFTFTASLDPETLIIEEIDTSIDTRSFYE